jgi:hypothetical protein
LNTAIDGHNGAIEEGLYAEALTGKAIKTINLIFQKILFAKSGCLFKMNLSKEVLP